MIDALTSALVLGAMSLCASAAAAGAAAAIGYGAGWGWTRGTERARRALETTEEEAEDRKS